MASTPVSFSYGPLRPPPSSSLLADSQAQLTLIWIFFTYPECAGLTLEQTGILFTDGFGVRKAEQMRKAQRQRDMEGNPASAESTDKV